MLKAWTNFMGCKAPAKPAIEALGREDGQTPVQSGLDAATKVATAQGWQKVSDIVPGDMVLTFDAGLQRVTQVDLIPLCPMDEICRKRFWPLEVPAGALGNRDVMHILPNQSLMVESDTAEDLYGDPFTLIPAEALNGLRGIHHAPPPDGAEIVHLHFAEEQVVFSESGTLFLCTSSKDMVDCAFEAAHDPLYSILPMHEARVVAMTLADEDVATPAKTKIPHELLDGAFA